MSDNARKMVKNVIEENAVDFKKATSKALYEKIGDRLKQEYVAVSQNLLKKKINEQVTLTPGNQTAQNLLAQAAPPAPPQPGSGNIPQTPGRKGAPPTQSAPSRPTYPFDFPKPPLWDRPDTYWIETEDIPEVNPEDYFPDGTGPSDPPSVDDFPVPPYTMEQRELYMREALESWRRAKEAYDRDQRRREQYIKDRERYFKERARQIQNYEKRGRGPSRLRKNPKYRENNPAYGIPGLPSNVDVPGGQN